MHKSSMLRYGVEIASRLPSNGLNNILNKTREINALMNEIKKNEDGFITKVLDALHLSGGILF